MLFVPGSKFSREIVKAEHDFHRSMGFNFLGFSVGPNYCCGENTVSLEHAGTGREEKYPRRRGESFQEAFTGFAPTCFFPLGGCFD